MKNNDLSVSSLPDKHLSADVMYQYLDNQLPPSERYEVERHLLDCDLCTDALAGFSISGKEKTRQQLFEINYHLKSRTQQRQPNQMVQHLKNWGITTAVLFLVILASLLVWYQVKQANTAIAPNPVTTIAAYTPAQPVIGQPAYNTYLRSNLRYPATARQLGITGTISVSFTVNPDSTLTDFQVVKGFRSDLNQEALRLIKTGPGWVPARRYQKPVAETKTITIPFRLIR